MLLRNILFSILTTFLRQTLMIFCSKVGLLRNTKVWKSNAFILSKIWFFCVECSPYKKTTYIYLYKVVITGFLYVPINPWTDVPQILIVGPVRITGTFSNGVEWVNFYGEKELSLCHKLWIYNPYIFETQCCKSLIFQTSYYLI